MIPLPVFVVLAQSVAGPMLAAIEKGEQRMAAQEAERREMQAQGEAVGRKYVAMGFDTIRLWRGTWMLARGMLTPAGAAALNVDGGTGKIALLATQPAPGGWVMGFLYVEGGTMRTYIQGPGRVEQGKTVPFKVSVDGGAFYGYSGEGLPDGTIGFKLPQKDGKRAKFRFGPREVEFNVEQVTALWWTIFRGEIPADAAVWAEEKAPTLPPIQLEPPPTLLLK